MNSTNSSNMNETEGWTKSTFLYDDPITALLIVAYGLVFLLCIIGNSVVCVVIIRTARLRTVTNYFILNLAVSDLLVGIFCLPFTLAYHIFNDFQFDDAMCKLTPFVQGVSVAASVFTFLMIAFDRYKAIVFPTEPRMTLKAMRKTLVGVWICALAISTPQIFVNNIEVYREGSESLHVCYEQWPDVVYKQTYTVMLLAVVYIVPLLSVLYLYGRIFHRMMFKPGPRTGGNLAANRNKCTGAVSKKRVRVIKMLITVVVLFAMSWLPLYTVWMLLDFGNLPKETDAFIHVNVFPFVHWFALSNSCVNPIVYGLFNSNIRKHIRSALSLKDSNGHSNKTDGLRIATLSPEEGKTSRSTTPTMRTRQTVLVEETRL
ncbi:neuropeptide FF receptor 2-like [Branchiostoma floridae x Branchiostoma japonicum]